MVRRNVPRTRDRVPIILRPEDGGVVYCRENISSGVVRDGMLKISLGYASNISNVHDGPHGEWWPALDSHIPYG